MATVAYSGKPSPTRGQDWLGRSWRENPPLLLTGLLMVVVLIAALVGLAVDARTVINEPVWLKPAKFAVSIALYSFTLLWLLTFLEQRRRLILILSWVIAVMFIIEEVAIGLQAMRGVRSHFNYTTSFDGIVFGSMAVAIVLVWVANLVVAILLLMQRFQRPALAWGLRFGVLIALVGMAAAFFMPFATPEQRERRAAGEPVATVGAHSVGVEDGGPGLPVVGWSTVGGDLRVPHFIGIHALQAMPLIGWLLTILPIPWLLAADRARLMVITGIGGVGLVVLLIWQALRGQPLIDPDRVTLGTFFGGLAVCTLAAAVVVGGARLRGGSNFAALEMPRDGPAERFVNSKSRDRS